MAAPFEVGAIFQDRYEVLDKLSAGGFGQVFKARQLATGQLVAIKSLLDRHQGKREKYIARFQREMQICAQLHHPNIVRLIDSGHTSEGELFSVFEFVPGKNLAQILAEEKRLSTVEATRLMSQVLDALSCAHEMSIVHRDLKPGNIMIASTGARRNALVLDFGIGAIVSEATDDAQAPITPTFERLGTPGYAAPEQLRGEPPTPLSDLYAWGLVFLECLTGARAIPGNSAMEVLHNQMSPEPIPIPAFLQGHTLGALLRVVTAKDPALRQVTAEGVLRQLESCDLAELDERRAFTLTAVDTSPTLAGDEDGPAVAGGEAPGDARPSLASRIEASRSEAMHSGERRQITAVSCTIGVLSDEESHLDIEEQDSLIQARRDRCVEIARRHGGHFAAALGHQVLFYFGYPRAQADDARRAALASLAIMDDLAREDLARGGTSPREPGARLSARVGMHTGLVVARESVGVEPLGSTGGSTPSMAARLESLAGWGQVAVSRSSYALLRHHFRFGDPVEHQVSGSAAAIELLPLLGPQEEPSSLRISSGSHAGQLVGRSEELALLRQRWEMACAGTGQIALISGEPGIGKSRLARELASMVLDHTHHWLEGRCMPDSQNSMFRPIIELLEQLLGYEPGHTVDEKRARLDALLQRFRLPLDDMMPLIGPLLSLPSDVRFTAPDVSPQRYKEMTLGAILSLFLEMAADQPVLIVIEDLHWADPTTIEFISLLIEETHTASICLVLTARPQFAPPWRAAELTQIRLGRLARDGVEGLIARITEGKALPPEVVDEIVERTDGVPLFVEELTCTVLESGALARDGDRYALVSSLDDHAIPTTLRDSLMARLDRLGTAKATAQLAATIGREFTRGLLARVSSLDDAALTASLNKLVAAELLFRRRRLGGETYIFKHALNRDVAYESLLKPVRQRYHELIAEALLEDTPGVAQTRPELIAHHFAGAGRMLDAVEYGTRAGQSALARSANVEAIGHARQAIKWLARLAPGRERAGLELALNDTLTAALMYTRGVAAAEVEQTVRRSQQLLDEVEDGVHLIPSFWMLHTHFTVRAELDTALALAERGLALGERLGDAGAQVAGCYMLGFTHMCLGDFHASRASLERGVALYDAAAHRKYVHLLGHDMRTTCLSTLALPMWLLGYPDKALEHAQAAVAWAREIGHANSIGFALAHLAGIRHYRDEPDQGREDAAELVDWASQNGLLHWGALGALIRAWADHDVDAGIHILTGFKSLGQSVAIPYWSATIADAQAARGDLDAAIARVDECLDIARANKEPYYLAELYRRKGIFLLRRDPGSYEEAERCLGLAVAEARARDARTPELLAITALCRSLRDRGAPHADAAQALRACHDWFTEGFDTPALVAARELLAALSA